MKSTMKMPTRPSRRGFLRAAGGTALMPFVPFLESDAEAAGFPKRLLLFFMPMGSYHPMWKPSGTETSFTLSPVLAPLAPYQSKLVVLDGIDNVAVSGGPGETGHPGVNCLWTGAPHSAGNFGSGGASGFGWPTGPSIDQAVAAQIARNVALRFNSIEVGFNLGGDYKSRMSFKGPDQPVPAITDPQVVYKTLFSDLQLSPAALQASQTVRKSVIDTVLGDLQRVRTSVPAADRPKFDAHLQNLRVIEGKLSVPVSNCSRVPAAPKVGTDYPNVLDAEMSLVTSAFACDLTRVASIFAGQESAGLGTPSFLGISEAHHPITHRDDAAGQALLVKITAWYMSQLKVLLDRLAAVPEGTGTMLDNTVVVCASPMGATSIHNYRGIPVVLAGSCGGAIKTGRYLKFGNFVTGGKGGAGKNVDYGGQPMNNLLVSLSNAMGYPMTTFGDKRFCTGPLMGL